MVSGLKKLILFIFLLLAAAGNTLTGQVVPVVPSDTIGISSFNKAQKDLPDYINLLLKKKTEVKIDTAKKKSLGPFYSPFPYIGYTMVTGAVVGFTQNISFYSHRSDDAKISSILINDVYSQYHQYINIVNSNLWLHNDKFNLEGDWRYYKFPTNTFGLGSKTSLNDADAVDYSHLRIYETIMGKIAGNLTGGIGYNLDYHWNLKEINQSPDNITMLDKYGLKQTSTSSGFTINLQFDNRLNANNPSKGTYINFQLRNNLQAMGSNANWQSLVFDARYYIKTSEETGNVLAFWSYNWITVSGAPPYFDLPSTGMDTYNNTGRGYVESRFRGLDLAYAEAEYRFRLTKNGLLGGVVFANASTVSEWPGDEYEKINPGTGFGLRIKMNKQSNSNLCVDYGIGTGGSRGFSFNLNEVF